MLQSEIGTSCSQMPGVLMNKPDPQPPLPTTRIYTLEQTWSRWVYRKMAYLSIPGDSFHGNKIKNSFESIFRSYRQLHDQRVGSQHFLNHVPCPQEVCTHAIHLVHEANAGNFIPAPCVMLLPIIEKAVVMLNRVRDIGHCILEECRWRESIVEPAASLLACRTPTPTMPYRDFLVRCFCYLQSQVQ